MPNNLRKKHLKPTLHNSAYLYDLKALVAWCATTNEKFLTLKHPAEFLTPYATLGRYPDTYTKLELYEVAELIKHAKKIVKLVCPSHFNI